jgi:hypothetical protein
MNLVSLFRLHVFLRPQRLLDCAQVLVPEIRYLLRPCCDAALGANKALSRRHELSLGMAPALALGSVRNAVHGHAVSESAVSGYRYQAWMVTEK